VHRTLRRQNNELLNSLSSKVSALKHVTIDIYDNARDQDSLDHSVRPQHSFSLSAAYAYPDLT
jgi:blocked-early-in-transport protein 1